MRARYSTILLCFFSCMGLHAQGPYWAQAMAGLGADQVADVKADASGSLYFTGEYGAPFGALGWNGGADVLVGKIAADGGLQWVVGAGGNDIDRGLKVCPTPDGNVVVVGQFMGTVDLFGTTAISQGGSQDVFVAKLNGANGQALWVNTGGSAAYSDRPYGVTVAPTGQVTVVGDFKGDATFGAEALSSTIDPILGEPGFDVFIASYAPSGTLSWIVQGAAPYTDRAIDVVSDAAGAVYVTGQFSDTITFATEHPNTLMNATFLLKLDASGTEQWFRRLGGASFSHVRDMAFTSAGGLLLCGDLQGVLVYEDVTAHAITASEPYSYYLLAVDAAGQYVSDAVLGSSNAMGVSGLAQHGDSVAVLGTFECQFTGLSDLYGDGLFMATGLRDLFIAKHTLSSMALRSAQQFGGGYDKQAGQLASLANGSLVFCGGFEQSLILPADASGWSDFSSTNAGLTYCGDANYGRFKRLTGATLLDGFIARGVVPGRRPYDFFKRSGSACLTGPVVPCVVDQGSDVCDDELHYCAPLPLPPPQVVMSNIWLSSPGVGPTSTYQWSMGSILHGQDVGAAGTYSCTVAAENGCYAWTDAAEVVLDPYPQPLLSDADGNIIDLPVLPPPVPPINLVLCAGLGNSYSLGGLSGGDAAQWIVGGSGVGPTFTPTGPGLYPIEVTGANGCDFQSGLNLVPSNSTPIPDITGVEATFHLASGAAFDGTDTTAVCNGSMNCVGGALDLAWEIDGAPGSLPPGVVVLPYSDCGLVSTPPSWTVFPTSEGTYPINVTVKLSGGPCESDTLEFTFTSEVYVAFLDGPVFDPPDALVICPGDTLPIPLNCTGCDIANWSGPGIIGLSPASDTAYVIEPGYYQVSAATTAQGAYCPGNTSFFVDPPVGPPLATAPANGIVCPGQPAWVYTTMEGSDFQWLGPSGPILVDNDSVQVTELGQYYLTMLNAQGCEVSNGPIALNAYGTPYLDIPGGDDVLCPGGSITVDVVAPGATSIQWSAPLAGSATTQVIDQPGEYTCSITSCGIITFAHITIVDGAVSAELQDPGPYSICAGGSVVLHGPDGGTSYEWLPGHETGQDLTVTGVGAFQLIVESPFGCRDTSSFIYVDPGQISQPVQADGATLCAGMDATLTATGSGTFTWYGDVGLTTVIGTGTTITVPDVPASTTVYVVQDENGCTGAPLPVPIVVEAHAPAPVITGDPVVCVGEALSLSVGASPAVTVTWTTPQGPVTGDPLTITAAGPEHDGLYSVSTEEEGCTSETASIDVVVTDAPPQPTITGGPEVCLGDSWSLTVDAATGTSVVWSTPQGTIAGDPLSYAEADAAQAGVYTVTVDRDGCAGPPASLLIAIVPCELVVPNIFSPNGDGRNDVIVLESPTGKAMEMHLFNRWGQEVFWLVASTITLDGRNGFSGEVLPPGVYFYDLRLLQADGTEGTMHGHIQLVR